MILLAVALAGGLGAIARFLVGGAVTRRNRLSTPLGTIVVNTTACFLLGVVAGVGAHVTDSPWVAVLGVGFLGGYSTFSTASVEAARLLVLERAPAAALHAGGMLVAGLLAALAGLALGSG